MFFERKLKNGYEADSVLINYEIFESFESERKENIVSDIPIIFIHGNEEDLNYFEPQYSYFSKKYKCIGVDSRGRGKSDFGRSTLSISLLADDVIDLLFYLKIPKVHIVGFSDGANIGLDIAFRKPEIVESLVFAGGNIFPKGIKIPVYFETLIDYYFYSFLTEISKISKKAGITEKTEKTEYCRKKEFLKLMVKEPSFTFDKLKSIETKTLVIVGENDVIKRSHSENIAKSLTNAKLKIIPKGSHFFPSEMPDVFNKEVTKFLENLNV